MLQAMHLQSFLPPVLLTQTFIQFSNIFLILIFKSMTSIFSKLSLECLVLIYSVKHRKFVDYLQDSGTKPVAGVQGLFFKWLSIKVCVFILLQFTTPISIVFMDGDACSNVKNTIGATLPIGLCSLFVHSAPHLPDSSKIQFSVWDFPFIPIKTKPAKFPPPNCVPVLKRRQPPAFILSGMKRGHRSCKAAQTCEMSFTRCSATSGVAMYDSVCAVSRKGKAFKATPAITPYKPWVPPLTAVALLKITHLIICHNYESQWQGMRAQLSALPGWDNADSGGWLLPSALPATPPPTGHAWPWPQARPTWLIGLLQNS